MKKYVKMRNQVQIEQYNYCIDDFADVCIGDVFNV